MPLEPALAQRLIAEIQQDRLVVLCGAGVSVAQPSCVPSAGALAEQCAREYEAGAPRLVLPQEVKNELGRLTNFLFTNGLQNLFVWKLVDWRPFRDKPNKGHKAVADLATCCAIRYVITTNFDELLELGAREMGEFDFEPCLDELSACKVRRYSPLVKLHGCVRDKDHTLWCGAQLQPPLGDLGPNPELQRRLEGLKQWLSVNLREKSLVLVGFWSDWSYLNDILETSLQAVHVPLVLLVDPQPDQDLEEKAPALWEWANGPEVEFHHIPEFGDQFLDELRKIFSVNFLTRAMLMAADRDIDTAPLAERIEAFLAQADTESLHSIRRDFCGVPPGEIPRAREPQQGMYAVAGEHLGLVNSGATLDGAVYAVGGRRVRVINGMTRPLSKVREQFFGKLPGRPPEDIIVCAGATDDGNVKPNIVRDQSSSTVVRPTWTVQWVTRVRDIT